MKFEDYYARLGVARTADAATIKKAYQKLARRFHPDVSKEADAEEQFKQVAEAYRTLKDPAARSAYDALGQRAAGQDFQPGADWREQFTGGRAGGQGNGHDHGGHAGFDEADFADLFASFREAGGRGRARDGGRATPAAGQDFEVPVDLTVEEAFLGRELTLELMLPEYRADGRQQRVATSVHARIPAGATQGLRLRVPGKGGAGAGGGRRGDLYLIINLLAHPVYRIAGHDVYLDVPLLPWEAVLGTSLALPTPGGPVRLTIAPGTQGGQTLRLPGRGLPHHKKAPGDLYALVRLVVPLPVSDAERALFQQLAALSTTQPRSAWPQTAVPP